MIRMRIGQTVEGASRADMDIALLLRTLMSDADMRQDELALILGVSQSTVSRISTGGQEPSYSSALKIIELAHVKGFLTNKTGTLRVVTSVEVRGHMTATDTVSLSSDGHAAEQVDLPFSIPAGCFAVIVDADGLTPRARKGDLIIAGPNVPDPDSMLDAEGIFRLTDGRCYFGILMESKEPQRYNILCQHNRRISNVQIAEVGPFFAVVAAGRWQSLT